MNAISDLTLALLILAAFAVTIFIYFTFRREKLRLIHRLFVYMTATMIFWLLMVALLRFVPSGNSKAIWSIDCLTYLGVGIIPVLSLLIAVTYVNNYDTLPKAFYLLFIMPAITQAVVWTNDFHHLQYKVFSLLNSEIEFGPYIYVSGAFSYATAGISAYIMLRFAFKNRNRLYIRQAVLFSIGSVLPAVTNVLGVLKVVTMNLAVTPLSFALTLLFHGFAIFRFHMLDIRPIALQRILNDMSDGYLIVSENGLVLSYNKSFHEYFGRPFGIRENRLLKDSATAEEAENKTVFYGMLSAIERCRDTQSYISYEQSLTVPLPDGSFEKKYYMVEITPLIIAEKLEGYLVFFKDITKIKESMQRLQNSQARMMEQDRLASLGQMVGGIAHNLKTPIMSISGSVFALEALVRECRQSLGDPEVTIEDYQEIYGEMSDWLSKTRDACAYMSDIITAVKEQAVNLNTTEKRRFTVDEMLKRVLLLLRHELVGGRCHVIVRDSIKREIWLDGDINNMVQVVNNLVSNAIDAEKPHGGNIYVELSVENNNFKLRVRDTGCGIPKEIRSKLFKQMITSKGAQGTGLGVFISNSVIKGKFFGEMWVEDNPGGGTVFGFSIPMEYVTLSEYEKENGQ